MPELKNGARQFKALTIDKFKGINIQQDDGTGGAVNEAYGLDESVSPEMYNFNISRDGHLTKRNGLVKAVDFTGLSDSVSRILGLMRNVTTQKTYIHVSSGGSVWRANVDGSEITNVLREAAGGGGQVVGSYEYISPPGTSGAYSTICIRAGSGTTMQAAGGIFGFYGSVNVAGAFETNTPVGTHLNFFKRRYWALNSLGTETNNDENRLWFSQPDDHGNWGGAGLPNNIIFDRGGGDFLVTTISYNDQLIVFMSRKTYILTAEGDPTGWTIRLVSDRVGCIGRKTVKSINGFIYFASHDGVYKTDGTTFELISGPVNDLIDLGRNLQNPGVVIDYMASYWDGKYILWTRNPDDSNKTNIGLVYDIDLQTWTKWTFPGRDFLSEIRYPDISPDTLFLSERNTKFLWKLGPSVFSDDGAAIEAKWVSKKMSFATPMQKTRNHMFGMSVRDDSGGLGGNWSVKIKPDDRDPGTYQVQNYANLSVANLKFRGAGYGRYFQTEVVHISHAFTSIYDMTWMNEDRGLIPTSYPVKNS